MESFSWRVKSRWGNTLCPKLIKAGFGQSLKKPNYLLIWRVLGLFSGVLCFPALLNNMGLGELLTVLLCRGLSRHLCLLVVLHTLGWFCSSDFAPWALPLEVWEMMLGGNWTQVSLPVML